MAYKAIVSFLVHLESFRNINLSHQGVYFVKISIYEESTSNDPIIRAFPLDIYSSIIQIKKAKVGNESIDLLQSTINNETGEFHSKSFIIRYCEEDVEINDFCEFRTEIDSKLLQNPKNFIMEIKLMFCEINLSNNDKAPISLKIEQFKDVSTKKYRISNSIMGISQYVPIVFEAPCYSLLNSLIHTCLIDFRYRPLPHLLNEPLKSLMNYDISNIKQLEEKLKTKNIKPLVNCLFEDDRGILLPNIDSTIINKVYDCYCKAMSIAYDNLFARFSNYEKSCLNEKQKSENCALFIIQPMIFPGEDEDEDELFNINLDMDLKNDSDISPLKDESSNLDQSNQIQSPDINISSIISQKSLTNKDDISIEVSQKESKQQVKPEDSVIMNDMDEKIEIKNQKIPFFNSKVKKKINGKKPIEHHTLIVKEKEISKISAKFALNISLLGGQIIELWQRFIELNKIEPRFIYELSQLEYNNKAAQKWGQSIIRNIVKVKDYIQHSDNKQLEAHMQEARTRRDMAKAAGKDILFINELTELQKAESHPVIFEQVCIRNTEEIIFPLANENYIHLFVLVHGFQGGSADVQMLKNNISLLHPESLILCSSENETKTEGDIEEMGIRLAKEIIQYINEWCPGNVLGKISFVGHSLGGIIVRAALPHLKEYKDKMFTLLTLSSPHLGYMYNSSKIIDAGMWLLKKLKKNKALQELTMEDSKSIESTFIYRLSNAQGLGWFKNIILIGSSQDSYVPIDSARIEISPKALNDKSKGNLYIEIVKNINNSIKTNRLHRMDVIFSINDSNLDSFIGRTAHIHFLDNDPCMKMILYRYYEQFV